MKVIETAKAPAAIGPYSQGYEVNGFVFSSGQIPVNPENGEIPEGIVAQANQSCKNVGAILEAAGIGSDLNALSVPKKRLPIWVTAFLMRRKGRDSNPSKCNSPVDCCLPPAGWRQHLYFLPSGKKMQTSLATRTIFAVQTAQKPQSSDTLRLFYGGRL